MKRKTKVRKKIKVSQHKYNFSIVILIVLLFFFILRKSSYFAFDKYLSYVGIFLFFSIWVVFNNKKFKIFQEKYLNYILLAFLIVFVLNFFTSIYFRTTFEEFMLWMSGFLLLFFVLNSINSPLDIDILSYGFIFLGLVFSTIPFLSKLGIYIFKDSIINERFASSFQYPNTFSAFLFIPLFLSFYKYEEEKRPLFSIFSSFFAIVLFLTKSRASLAILFFLILISAVFIKKDKFRLLTDEVLLLIIIPLFHIFLISKLGLILSLIISLAISYMYAKLSTKIKVLSSPYPLLALIILSISLLKFSSPDFLMRILSLFKISTYKGTSGLSGRNALMLTALRIFKSHPIFGSGPGTYQFVYFKYRPTMIFSKFPHSSPFQILSEMGIVGFTLYVLFLWFILKKIFSLLKSNNLLFFGFSFAFLGVLLHTFIDFDLSIPAMFYVFFTFLGILFSLDLNRKEMKFIEIKKFLPYASTLLIVLVIINVFLIFGASFSNKGKSFLNKRQYEYAQKNLEQSTLLDPLNSDYHHNLGKTLEFIAVQNKDMNYLKIANKELKKAIELNPYFFLYHASIGESYLYLNEKEKGIEEFKKAVELNPLDGRNYVNLSMAYEKFDMLEEATNILENALSKGIESSAIYMRLGDLYKLGNKFGLAERNYKKAIKTRQNLGEAYYKLGLLYKEMGKIPDMIHYLWLSVRYSKWNPEYVKTFEQVAPTIKIVSNFEDVRLIIGKQYVISWDVSGNKEYMDYLQIVLVSTGDNKIIWRRSVYNMDKDEYTITVPEINEGKYKFRIVAMSRIMDKYGGYLSWVETEVFYISK